MSFKAAQNSSLLHSFERLRVLMVSCCYGSRLRLFLFRKQARHSPYRGRPSHPILPASRACCAKLALPALQATQRPSGGFPQKCPQFLQTPKCLAYYWAPHCLPFSLYCNSLDEVFFVNTKITAKNGIPYHPGYRRTLMSRRHTRLSVEHRR